MSHSAPHPSHHTHPLTITFSPNTTTVHSSTQKQLKDFDNLTTQLLTQAEKEVLPQQEIQDTNARLELKEKQLKEIAEAMRSYSPVEELRKKYELEAKQAKEEAEKYRRDVMKKMQEELERRKAEQKKREGGEEEEDASSDAVSVFAGSD